MLTREMGSYNLLQNKCICLRQKGNKCWYLKVHLYYHVLSIFLVDIFILAACDRQNRHFKKGKYPGVGGGLRFGLVQDVPPAAQDPTLFRGNFPKIGTHDLGFFEILIQKHYKFSKF